MRKFLLKHDGVMRGVLFALCVLAAFTVPAWHVRRYLNIRNQGLELKFRCASRDPYTPFLGRYLTVRLAPTEFESAGPWKWEPAAPVYMKFRAGKDGFAEVVSCTQTPPEDMTGVWRFPGGRGQFSVSEKGRMTQICWWRYPVERYYLNEKLALTADRIGVSQNDIIAYVCLKDGCGIIRRLTIKGEGAETYLRKAAAGGQ